ncbi:MAG: hypothetical protein E6J20_11940 [Chloroflexi bacterium]|nr:MAG: hypothetical protein E6J20_11940 [Chloroflexota bacterium]
MKTPLGESLTALRVAFTASAVAVIALVTVVLTGLGIWAWGLNWPQSDRLTLEAVLLTAGTFVLALVAAVVALAAYVAATQTPDLAPTIVFHVGQPNRPVFTVEAVPPVGKAIKISEWLQTQTTEVRIENRSRSSARNPALRIDLVGLSMTDFSAPGWEIVQRVRQRGVTAIQWDGGADYAIHGRWTRELPGFNLQDMYLVPEHLTCELRLTVVADGFNRVVRLPVEIIGPDQQPVALTSPPSQTALTP